MPNREDVLWFKTQFQERIQSALDGTPFSVDMITAIACQETGHIWSVLRSKGLGVPSILSLCVGDTLDADKGRTAFPKTKADLVAKPGGQEMFEIARQALVEMAKHIPGFAGAAGKPNKFCHGFGLFQYDLQFFLTDPHYFLLKKYEQLDEALAKCLGELKNALKKVGLDDRTSLSGLEMAAVAIAYNTGGFKPSKALKQGYFDGTKFYGEAFFDFIRLSQTVGLPGHVSALVEPHAGEAIIELPSSLVATGPFFKVETQMSTLRLRSEPKVSAPPTANVIGEMPDGHPVRAVTGTPLKGFMEVETSLAGALLRGFAATKFLKTDPDLTEIPTVEPMSGPPTTGVIAVTMPNKLGRTIKRSDDANAHSLNEAGQPGRQGKTAETLRADLARIIDWLAVDKKSHKRYQPRTGLTFCNIYCHDYCHLAGVYLPRVWWTSPAIVALSQGKTVEPLIGSTIVEVLANDVFRWLREFGPSFGWRQTGTLSKLQLSVNQGAVGLIVARRSQDGRSGHIVAVVPETETERSRRDAAGEIISPLQSQAGATNFRYGTGPRDWWRHEQFAESGFWLHA